MPTLWFVMPLHGRHDLTRICLRQLRRTCDALGDHGIEATAVLVCDAAHIRRHCDLIDDLGFGTVQRANDFLSAKFNDGIQFACDPAYNPRPADYVMPCGSDDWIDHRILLDLPAKDTVLAFNRIALVREDGQEMTARKIVGFGGSGLRVYPREVVEACDYRPADEDRRHGCDTSIILNLERATSFNLHFGDIDARQLVDWKSRTEQVTSYYSAMWRRYRECWREPFDALRDFYPPEALAEMQAHYA